jgi:hypothetical protein
VQQITLQCRRGRADGSPDVRYWHKADIDFDAEHVRFWGKAEIADRLANVR